MVDSVIRTVSLVMTTVGAAVALGEVVDPGGPEHPERAATTARTVRKPRMIATVAAYSPPQLAQAKA